MDLSAAFARAPPSPRVNKATNHMMKHNKGLNRIPDWLRSFVRFPINVLSTLFVHKFSFCTVLYFKTEEKNDYSKKINKLGQNDPFISR